MSVTAYVVQCNAQHSAKRVVTNPWAASLIQRGWNILPRASRIHITEQQSPLDFSVIFPIMMMKKCKIIYSGSEILSFFFFFIPEGQLLILYVGVR
jgi:hypothetical protein